MKKIKMGKVTVSRGTDSIVGAVGMRPKSACKTLRKGWIATEYVTGGSVIGGQRRNRCGEDTEGTG